MTAKTIDIVLPGDLFPTIKELADYSIDQAREEMDDYVIPATWESVLTKGEPGDFEVVLTVTRYSR